MPRRFATLLLCLGIVFSISVKASADEELAAPLAKLQLADGDTVVFLGDSITHQCLYTQYVEDYFYTRMPKARIRFHNSGVGGDRAIDALNRFERDVAFYKPKYVTVLLGMNDGSYQPYNDAIFQTYRGDMTRLVDKIKATGAMPVLMTPTMYDARAKRLRDAKAPAEPTEFYNATLAYYGAWVREQAVERGLGFVDMYSPLNNLTLQSRETDPKFTLIKDAVHPDAPGQLVMAYALLYDLGVPRKVSGITLSRGADGKVAAKASGGKISDARYTSDGVEFTFAATSLPLAVPEDAQLGAKLTAIGHRLGQEVIEVHDLAPGKYQLLIDGEPIGQYAVEALERHVELQGNVKTPQYRQAQAVVELNHERNESVMKPLRNLWRDRKILNRSKIQLSATPDNAKLKASVEAMEKKLADFDEQVAAFDAQAKSFEDRIYQQNQPPARKYQLVRLTETK
jgi:lysophospholipase L1-like esterase